MSRSAVCDSIRKKNKLKKKIDFNENVPIEPYYEGFKGTICKEDVKGSTRYIFKGKYEIISHYCSY